MPTLSPILSLGLFCGAYLEFVIRALTFGLSFTRPIIEIAFCEPNEAVLIDGELL